MQLFIAYPKLNSTWHPVFFWPCHAVLRILVPRTGIVHAPPAVEMQSLNHWTTKEVSILYFYLVNLATLSTRALQDLTPITLSCLISHQISLVS